MAGLLKGAGLSVIIAYLFYRHIAGLLIAIVIIPFCLTLYRKELKQKNTEQMQSEFKEYMLIVANTLQTGYSLERALRQSEGELKKLYAQKSVLIRDIHEMNQKISMNMQVEKAFYEFANNTKLEEAISLADILSFSKRAGGDYGKQIRNAAIKIEDKLMVQQEINTVTAEKRLELKIMCYMPLLIIGYIAVTSRSFIEPLYITVLGRIVMSFCLIVYAVMISLGKRMIEIKV